MFGKNPETTVTGILMVIGGIADGGLQLVSGHFDGDRLKIDGAAILTGYGLIRAKDASTHSTVKDVVDATVATDPVAAHALARETGVEAPK